MMLSQHYKLQNRGIKLPVKIGKKQKDEMQQMSLESQDQPSAQTHLFINYLLKTIEEKQN
jgi:bifunctional DNase/RNase